MSKINLIKGEKAFSFDKILWLLKDANFYRMVTELLNERRVWNESVFKFALYHKDKAGVR